MKLLPILARRSKLLLWRSPGITLLMLPKGLMLRRLRKRNTLSLSKKIHFEFVISNFIRRVRGRIPRLPGNSLNAATRNVSPAPLSMNFQVRIKGKIKLKGRLLFIWLLLHREVKEGFKEVSKWRVILFFASCFFVSCMYFHAASFPLDPKVAGCFFSLHGMPKHRLTAGVGRFLNVYMAHHKAAK